MKELNFSPEIESPLMKDIKGLIPNWNNEINELLPAIPNTINVEIRESKSTHHKPYRENDWSFAVGGSTPNPNTVLIEVDTAAEIPHEDLIKSIKATFYHEHFHIARGYSFESSGLSLIDVAIEEGLATRFEMANADSNPWYGEYSDEDTMLVTLDELVKADQKGDIDWPRWKFHDPDSGRSWILYRAGSFIIDEALTNSPSLHVQDLVKLTTKEILALAGL